MRTQMGLRPMCDLLNALYSFPRTPQPAPPSSLSPALLDAIIFPTSILYFRSPSQVLPPGIHKSRVTPEICSSP